MNEHRALLLTDVVDSTRIAEIIGDAANTAHWVAHDRAARELLRTWRGREIERTDGLMAVFDSAADAAAFAIDYHRALAALGLPFKARAGLHFGAIALRESSADDVAVGAKRFEVGGLAIPIAARVMATAQGGQTLLTGDARGALGITAMRVQSHGFWRLKGLQDPVELSKSAMPMHRSRRRPTRTRRTVSFGKTTCGCLRAKCATTCPPSAMRSSAAAPTCARCRSGSTTVRDLSRCSDRVVRARRA